MAKINRSISLEELALLFRQLERLEKSGLPAVQAFDILIKSDDRIKKSLAIMQQQLNAGRPISEAGFRAGIFNDTHKTLIHAGQWQTGYGLWPTRQLLHGA
jgi:type II secretory pathway component PulF